VDELCYRSQMLEYFGQHRRLRIEALSEQLCIGGNLELAQEIDKRGELVGFSVGETFIEQDTETNDVFFILAGVCDIVVNGRTIAKRGPRTHVGEMAAIQPTQRRSANAIVSENMVAIKLSEPDFSEIAAQHSQIYKSIAKELARRLLERNLTINQYRAKIKIFIISSAESLSVARAVQNAFEHDPFTTIVWTDGVFKVASYPLQDLEAQIDDSDFALAIAHPDDFTESRGEDWPSPRDNVIFELGLFMGRLGRARAILMEPREEKVKLPSDLTGITTITYSYKKGENEEALIAPACNRLRDHINALGPNNG
jgi:CRP/FNR family transcriptional regulator, cyclic AMP receptor protein